MIKISLTVDKYFIVVIVFVMGQDIYKKADDYICQNILGEDQILSDVLESNKTANLPSIDVSPPQGKFLTIICAAIGAKSVLEIGTLGGYSTICLARGVGEDGKVITLERSAEHAEVAQNNLKRAGVLNRVELLVGLAASSLERLYEVSEPFDLIFIDADKVNNPIYLTWAVKMSHPGTLIVIDNVILEGSVIDENDKSPAAEATRLLYKDLKAHPQLDVTVLQSVGSKGWDGFALALVR